MGRLPNSPHRRRVRRPARYSLEGLEPRLLLAAFRWAADVSGDFNTAANWRDANNQPGVPGSGDDATIGFADVTVTSIQTNAVHSLTSSGTLAVASGTFTVGSASTTAGLVNSGGIITGPGPLGVSTTLSWTGGNFTGSGTTVVAAGGTLTISGAARKVLVQGYTVEVAGNAAFSGGFLEMHDAAQLVIDAGATFAATDDALITDADFAPGTIVNRGTFAKTGGTGTTQIHGDALQNTGTFRVATGTVSLNGASTNSGTLRVDSGATLSVDNNTLTLASGTSVTGGGTLGVGGGTLEADVAAALPNLAFSSGTITGAGPIAVAGSFAWTGGSFTGTGTTAVAAGGTLAISGAARKGIDQGYTVEVGGAGTFAGGELIIKNAAQLVVDAGGSFAATDDAAISNDSFAPGAIVNRGTFAKTGGTGTTQIYGEALQNSGTVRVDSGTLGVLSPSAGGGTNTGTLVASPGTTLSWDNNTFTLGAGTSLQGVGTFRVTSGTLAVAADASLTNLALTGGFLGGTNALTATSSLSWSGGGMLGTGTLKVAPGATATLSGPADKLLEAGYTLEIGGSASFAAGSLDIRNNSRLVIDAGATFAATDDALITDADFAPGSIVNRGIFAKTGGTGTTQVHGVALDSTGTFRVDTGSVATDAKVLQVDTIGNLLAGTWVVAGGSSLSFSGKTVTTNAGTVQLLGPGASFATIASLATNSGELDLLGGASFTTAGALTNSGKITLGPGSRLTVQGAYAQSASGALTTQVGGTSASGGFGQLVATGTASLGGTLAATLVNGFGPGTADDYPIVTDAGQSGSPIFSGPSLGHRPVFGLTLKATSADLVVTSTVAPADLSVAAVATPAPVSPGAPLTVTYTVKNLSQVATIVPAWDDSVYVSTSAALDATAYLLGRVPHTGGLAAGATYDGTLTAAFPPLVPGSYRVFVVADSRGYVPDPDRSNNVGSSPGTFAVSVPDLALGTPASGTIAAGQDIYYRIAATAGQTLVVAATGPDAASIRYAAPPSDTRFDQAGSSPLIVASTQPGEYYVRLHGTGSGSYTLSAGAFGLTADSFGPAAASNAGTATLTIRGTGFSGATATLIGPGGVARAAQAVVAIDTATLAANFDLSGLPVGSYTVRLSQGGASVDVPGTFAVTSGSAGQVRLQVTGTSILRPGQEGVVTIDYMNTGSTDVPAPLIRLTGTGLNFRMPGQATSTDNDILLLGINPSGPLGVLPPGFHGTVQVPFLPTGATAHFPFSYTATLTDPNQAFDWAGLGRISTAAAVSPAGWANVVAAARPKFGETWGQVVAALDRSLAKPIDASGPASTAALAGDYDFLRLLRVGVTLAGSPAFTLAGPPSGGPAGLTTVASIPKMLTLNSVGATLKAGQHTYLITPGLSGGDPDPNDFITSKPRYLELARAIAKAEPNANVLLLDWSPTAPKTVFIGGGAGTLGGFLDVAHINPTADALAGIMENLQDQGLFDPTNATFVGESYGNPLNDRVASDFLGAGRGQVYDTLAFDPPNETVGYRLDDLGVNFAHSYAFETCLIYDSHLKLGLAHAVTMGVGGAGGGPAGFAVAAPSNFTILENFAKADDSELGVVWLNSRLAAGDPSWLTPEASVRATLGAGNQWDGLVNFGVNYDPTPVKINTCFPIGDGSDDEVDDPEPEPEPTPEPGPTPGPVPGDSGGSSGGGGGGDGSGGGDNGPVPAPPDPDPNAPDDGGAGSGYGDVRTPHDPNDIVGPAGYGAAGYLDPGHTLPYTVNFENQPTAGLPAQVVTVTDRLDPSLDWSTFQLGGLGFGSYRAPIPPGMTSYSARIDARATRGLFVDVAARFDPTTGVATWTFTSIDPTTGDQTGDTLAGFLPPDTAARDGQGFVSYSARPKAGLASGATIAASASVVFDTNAALATAPISNAIDAGSPAAAVTALPAFVYGGSIPVSWSGADEPGGSGVATYNLYAATDGGPLQLYRSGLAATSIAYPGQVGHTYGFAVAAVDNVGHVQATPSAAQATTMAVATPVLQFAAGATTVDESAGTAQVTIVRLGSALGAVTVHVATAGGDAVPGVNYRAISQDVTFADGQTSQVVAVPVLDDGVAGPDRAVGLVLAAPGGGATLGTPAVTTLVIRNTDPAIPPPPAPVMATGASVKTVVVKHHRVTELVIQFSGALDPAAASSLGAYRLVTAGRDKKFGTKDDKVVRLASASYSPATHAVTITPRGALPNGQTLQLRAFASVLRDSSGRPIDGDHDGRPGGDLVLFVSRRTVRIAARRSPSPARAHHKAPRHANHRGHPPAGGR